MSRRFLRNQQIATLDVPAIASLFILPAATLPAAFGRADVQGE